VSERPESLHDMLLAELERHAAGEEKAEQALHDARRQILELSKRLAVITDGTACYCHCPCHASDRVDP
jgi:hypothetical protein